MTLCHATSSDKNPYVQVSVDDDSIVKENGHGDHPDDIIPPFDYVEGGVTKHYAGLNWNTTGQAIWENGCEVPPPGPVQLPIQPVLKCIDDNGVSFQAVFGYSNPNAGTVTIPAGSSNAFSPGPVDRGQPTTFQPGTVESAVTVTGSPGSSLTWTVTYGGVASSSAPASSSFPTRCSAGPSPSPAPIEIFVKCVDNTGGTFSATFGYVSSATDVVTIPAGSAANSLAPVPPAGGPPSTFQPGNHDTAFTVTGISNGTSLVWTLTSDVTRTATATNAFPTKCTAEPTPKPIAISVTCIRDRGQSFEATFGYVNENGAPVSIPIGPDNDVTVRVSRSAGQPQTFEVGGVTDAFTVTGVPAGADVEWRVTYAGVTSVATANEAYPTHCAVDPPDPPDPYRIGVFVSCVTNEGSTYSATFGYENEDTQANSVAIGDANRFFPAPEDRGQPTRFEPGNVQAAFTVTGIPAAATVIWTLTSDQTRSAEASANFETKCNPDPPPADLVPIGVFVTCVTNHGDTFDAVFGYTNDNRAEQIIPLGIRNTFLQAPGNRGQPTTFEPGTVRNAVTVTGIPNGSLLVWSVELVRIRVAVASQFVPQKCDEPPLPPDPPPPEPTPPPEPPDPTPPPPDPRPPESGLFATCVVRLAETATYDAIFGYANASQEDVLVPVGRRNFVAPTPINRGQPAVFRPGVVPVAFTVKNVPRGQDLTWAVRLPGGEIRTATASAKFPRNCITAPAPPTADLVLTKSVRDAEVVAGRRVTYTIRVLNRGPNLALRVRIEDVVDPRLDLLSASTTRGTCTTSGQRVSCTITELPPGALVSVVIAVRARTAGTIRNVASVSHSRPDPTPENNRDDAVITVTGRTGGVSPAFTG